MEAIIKPFESSIQFVTTKQVHPTLFPYLWAPTLHALRVSLAYQSIRQRTKATSGPVNVRTSIAGYLVFCWGGMAISHSLLSMPPPFLYSIHPYINYLVPHLALSFFFNLFPDALNQPITDVLLAPLDAVLRATAVPGTLSLLASSSVDSRLVNSALFHVILGAIAAGGGGAAAITLTTWQPTWTLSTPYFLRDGVGFLATIDLWGGAVVAALLGFLTGHPAFNKVSNSVLRDHYAPSEARAVGAIFFFALFATRATRAYTAAFVREAPKDVQVADSKQR